MTTRSPRAMAQFRNELRANLPVHHRPVRVKMGMGERIIRMLRKGSIGFGLVAMIVLCGVSRMLASLVSAGRLSSLLCILVIALPLIILSGYLLDDKESNQQQTPKKMKTSDDLSLTLSDSQEVSTPKNQNLSVMALDLTQPLPDLETADVMPIDLMSDYWTPESPGESKRLVFVKLDTSPVRDVNDPEVEHQLACAYFLEKTLKGEIRQIRNGSKRLVGALQTVIEQGMVGQGTPLLVTFLGKKQNRTNSFKSDNWSIKPLKLNVG